MLTFQLINFSTYKLPLPNGRILYARSITTIPEQQPDQGGIQAMQIEEVWEDIMGKTIARYTDKLQIIGDKLIITTSVGPLKNELIYQKEKSETG